MPVFMHIKANPSTAQRQAKAGHRGVLKFPHFSLNSSSLNPLHSSPGPALFTLFIKYSVKNVCLRSHRWFGLRPLGLSFVSDAT